MNLPRLFLVLVALLASLATAVAGCTSSGQLLPAAESAIDGAELALCDAALPAVAASTAQPEIAALTPVACPGSEAMLKLALDHVTAAAPAAVAGADAGAPTVATVAARVAAKIASTHPLVKTSRGYAVWLGTRCLGYVPSAQTASAVHTPAAQAYLASVAPVVAELATSSSSSTAAHPDGGS